MAKPDLRRSQPIMLLPVDSVPVTLILDDGERIEGLLSLAPGDDITRLLRDGDPFVAVELTDKADQVRLVARPAIACVSVAAPPPATGDLPLEHQTATLRVRGGTTLEGELRWVAVGDHRRAKDFLNDSSMHFVELYAAGLVTYVLKTHLMWVEER